MFVFKLTPFQTATKLPTWSIFWLVFFLIGSPKLPQNRSQCTLKVDHVALLTLRWLSLRCLSASHFCCQTDCLAVCVALGRLISSCPNPRNMPPLYMYYNIKYIYIYIYKIIVIHRGYTKGGLKRISTCPASLAA